MEVISHEEVVTPIVNRERDNSRVMRELTDELGERRARPVNMPIPYL